MCIANVNIRGSCGFSCVGLMTICMSVSFFYGHVLFSSPMRRRLKPRRICDLNAEHLSYNSVLFQRRGTPVFDIFCLVVFLFVCICIVWMNGRRFQCGVSPMLLSL